MDTPKSRRSHFALIASLAVLVIVLLVVLARFHFGGGVTQPPQVPAPMAPVAPRAGGPEAATAEAGPATPPVAPVLTLPPPPPPPLPEEATGAPAAGDLPVIENPDAPAPESALPPAKE